jgi:hypothetical protein
MATATYTAITQSRAGPESPPSRELGLADFVIVPEAELVAEKREALLDAEDVDDDPDDG